MIQRVKGSAFNTMDDFGYVSLLDYVTNDGITDVAPFILAILAAGKVVFVPAGIFLCSPLTLPAGARILGAGDNSVLQLKAASNSPCLTLAGNIVLKDFKVDGNKVNQTISNSHGVAISAASNTKVLGLSVINCRGDGINVDNSTLIEIRDVFTTGNTVNGVRIQRADDVRLSNVQAYLSDGAATGDGIAISSAGNAVNRVTLTNCTASYNINRGISILGFGSKNVIGVTLSNCLVNNNTSHGIHAINVEQLSITGGQSSGNGQDGIRIEGDVQYSRVSGVMLRSNVSFALREVTAGTTPNNNGLIYNVARSNGNDTITKVGASSFIV